MDFSDDEGPPTLDGPYPMANESNHFLGTATPFGDSANAQHLVEASAVVTAQAKTSAQSGRKEPFINKNLDVAQTFEKPDNDVIILDDDENDDRKPVVEKTGPTKRGRKPRWDKQQQQEQEELPPRKIRANESDGEEKNQPSVFDYPTIFWKLARPKIHPITSYIDLSKVFVFTEFKIKKIAEDGLANNLVAADSVGLIQMPGATFIRNLKVHINQREVYDSNQLYSYKVYLDTELSYPIAAKDAYFGVAGYFRDSDPSKLNDKRKKPLAESKSYQTISKLSADIFNQDLYMISNVEIDIELALQSDDFMFA
uniref:Capsid protein n=1 Tax=Globodera pallida TaxID=36090 RepID=A0A183C6X9_GLOPA